LEADWLVEMPTGPGGPSSLCSLSRWRAPPSWGARLVTSCSSHAA